MKSASIGGILVLVVALTAAAWLAFDGASGGGCAQSGDCARCHKGSPPSTHTPGYVAEGHGPAALLNRASCLGCHKRESCDECHLKERPKWHTSGFRAPGRGREEREEHVRVAAAHRQACGECHAVRFASQCAECHRPDEAWLKAAEGER
ncbi:MAG: hypothetical protein FD180_4936 [Planctomycetota bacterium]|nr:MAG: hypothetical protein FD180_4936 [Planctomycetota bacterium]